MKITKISVQNPIAVVMFYTAIVIIGLIAFFTLPRDAMPEIDFPALTVVTVYPGASPEAVENDVTSKLEIALATTPQLKSITSRSRENVSIITLTFEWGADITEAANNVRDLIELVKNDLPQTAEPPFVIKINSDLLPIVVYAISVEQSKDEFTRLYNTIIAPHLRRVEGVGTVFPIAHPEKVVYVEIDPLKLKAYNIHFQQIALLIQSQKVNVPAGFVQLGKYDFALHVPPMISSVEDIKNVKIGVFGNRLISLGDIADIRIDYKTKDEIVRSAGKQSIAVFVQKQTGKNTLKTYRELTKAVEELQTVLPSDVRFTEVFNTADFVSITLNNLGSTLWWGAIWVTLVVWLFLRRTRLSLIVLVTMPVSLIISFVIMYLLDYTVNIFSLMSLIVAMGMVVDNSIVVLENITRHVEYGVRPREAAIFGSDEMALAISASTMTTISVFVPLLFVGGMVGMMFQQMVIIVIVTMLSSLLTALTLTPALSSFILKRHHTQQNRLYQWSERMFCIIENVYKNLIAFSLKRRFLVLIIFSILFIGGLFIARFLGTDYVPELDTGDVIVVMEMDEGTSVQQTEQIAMQVEQMLRQRINEIQSTYIIAGQTEKGLLSSAGFTEGKNIATVGLRLKHLDERKLSSRQIAEILDTIISNVPAVNKYRVSGGSILASVVLGNIRPVQIKIFGHDLKKMELLAKMIADSLRRDGHFSSIEIPSGSYKPIYNVVFDKDRISSLGFNHALLSMQIRHGLYGTSAGMLSIDGQDYEVIMRYPDQYRHDMRKIDDYAVTNMAGQTFRLGDVAQVRLDMGYQEIVREGQQRVLYVTAQPVGISLGEAGQKIKHILQNIDVDPDLDVQMAGQLSEQSESFENLTIALLVGIMLVYMIMASLFKSFIHPFVIMFSVPFTFVGVILALYVSGHTISIVTFSATIMLMGIVVNNAIVLVDYTNLLRARGMDIAQALAEAGRTRLRPVLMTTLTTILAMIPMALNKTMGYEIWSPLGITIIGGLAVSTLITLVLVPVMYLIIERK